MNAEPVGSKAPTFSTASKISMFVQKSGDNLALLCQAQAFPVPLIRYVLSKTLLHNFWIMKKMKVIFICILNHQKDIFFWNFASSFHLRVSKHSWNSCGFLENILNFSFNKMQYSWSLKRIKFSKKKIK